MVASELARIHAERTVRSEIKQDVLLHGGNAAGKKAEDSEPYHPINFWTWSGPERRYNLTGAIAESQIVPPGGQYQPGYYYAVHYCARDNGGAENCYDIRYRPPQKRPFRPYLHGYDGGDSGKVKFDSQDPMDPR